MSSEPTISRSRKIAKSLLKLTGEERRQLEKLANGSYYGGDVLKGSLRSKAAELGLAFSFSGRLRPDVYKILRGDDAFIVDCGYLRK